ncbi:DUF5681 domain-containing protein [Lutimaribacter marinistellae]|uniref:DUF5681 domain-containing protein n=1 Tax=Lutimaribacter marinistellae TaxID=1820329 RepID=A0ABV7TN82_9RHOB
MSKDNDYEVGYGKPPKHTRFRKGQSGNARGRKQGSCNFQTDLEEVLEARVAIKENGQARKVTSQQAALRRLLEKALAGDPRALDRLLNLAEQLSDAKEARSAERSLSDEEADILRRYEETILTQALADGRLSDDGEAGDAQ